MGKAMNSTSPYGGPVAIEIVYETHSVTEDNERGIATGWQPRRLSPRGREQAAELGRRPHQRHR
jgi:broad specificity phosphatase PhoE